MAEAVVSFAVERLGDLLISETKFLSGVKDKVFKIQRQLKELQNFLKDADNKRGNREVGKWVTEIRELALQTEDVLETYAVKVASRREGGHIKEIMRRFACIIGECITLHKIGSEIGTIQDKITNLATSRQTFGIQALDDHQVESSNARQRQLRISYAHVIEKDFVGMEDEIEKLVLRLKSKDRGYEVVSLWGMGGQGKTAIVKQLYHHPEVRYHFQAFAWVCVTQKLEREKVLQDILQGLLPTMKKEEIRGMGDTELIQLLHKTQKELKCLIVTDDIWEISDWEILKPAFPIDDEISGSKILLTTRNKIVADANIGFSHKIRSLTGEESWKLLVKKVFPKRDNAAEISVEPEKEKLGRDMVEQCQGLPLAISALRGILKNKNSLREWEMVKKDIGSNLTRGENGGVGHILGLSYDDLPFRLKQLFLYLGTFKEDEEIESCELYLLWIAEGMIHSNQKAKGEMLVDVAERYLVELSQRSLVQLESMDERGWKDSPIPWLKVRSCRLHDLIRDLCLSKGKDEDFLKMIDFRGAHNESYRSVIGMEARRLVIYMYDDANNLDNIALEQQQMVGQLRSLLFFNACNLWKRINNLKNFKLVRVLKFKRLKFTRRGLSRGIIELIHLRYLCLEDCEIEELPSCIGDLRYLETLDLRVLGDPVIPDVLWKIKHLKNLYLPIFIRVANKKLIFDGLKELELLWNFDASKCDVNDLMKLTDLQVLAAKTNTLQEQEGMRNFVNSGLHHLRYTFLIVCRDYDLIQLLQCENLNELNICGDDRGNYVISQPYEQSRPSQSLTRIRIIDCNIEAEAMVLLEKLPKLQHLELRLINSFAGKEFVCTANSFPQLINLLLSRVDNLEKWRVDEGAMPNLSKLDIWHCRELDMLPDGLKFLKSLRELSISGMPKAFNNRVQVLDGVEGQDFHKIRHIPNIFIRKELDWTF